MATKGRKKLIEFGVASRRRLVLARTMRQAGLLSMRKGIATVFLLLAASRGLSAQGLGADFRTVCWNGDLDRVKALLAQHPPLEEPDVYGRTPLYLASHGNPDVVKLLLASGAKVNVVDKKGDSPLINAAGNGGLVNVQVLVAAGADLNHADQAGSTPIDFAASQGHDDIVAWLLGQHASQTAGNPLTTALSWAVAGDHVSTAKLLLDAGAQVPVPESVKSSGHSYGTILQTAANLGDRAMIDLLLDHGGNINEGDSNGRSAFCCLIMGTRDAGLVADLLDRGADPNLSDRDGATPTREAFEYDDGRTIIELLMQHGGNLDAQDPQGKTELMTEARNSNIRLVTEILSYHPNVNLQDKKGETALTYAGDRGCVEIVQMLEAAGAQPRDLHIIPKAETEPLTPAQKWALAVGALYAQRDGISHDSLNQGPDHVYQAKRALWVGWGVKDHDSLTARLQPLDAPMDWTQIAAEQAHDLNKARDKQGWLADVKEAARLPALELKWGTRVEVAWNSCRAANVISDAVTAGYISEAEAWPILMSNARIVQTTFGSWQEMNECFLETREVWAGERTPDFDRCADLLLNSKEQNSPWNQLAWNTDLGK